MSHGLHLVIVVLGTLILQAVCIRWQTQSPAAELDTNALSFSTVIEVLGSNDAGRLRDARKKLTSLCGVNNFENWQKTCEEYPKTLHRDEEWARRRRRRRRPVSYEFAFALVLNARDQVTFDVFVEAYGSIRHFHPQNAIVVVDNASPLTISAQVMDMLHNEPNTLYAREDISGFEIGGYGAALRAARRSRWDVRGWVFLQGPTVLLQPLPLRSLPCKVTPFFRASCRPYPPGGLPEFDRAEYEAFRNDSSRTLNFTEFVQQESRRLKYEYPLWQSFWDRH